MKTVQAILMLVSATSFAVACKPAIRDPAASALSTPVGPPVDPGESRTLDITLPFPGLGYYSGLTGSLSGADVCSGKALFGEEGMAVCQQGVAATPASAAHVLAGREFWDSTGTKVTGTMPLGANVAGANGQRVITIPAGYYDGSKTVTAADANLLAANIATGVTIFGTTGTAGLETHIACTASGQSGCVSNASFLAGAPQGNASGANGQLSFLIPQGYYDGTKSATAADAALLAGNIRAGATIFGVAGNVVAESHANCGGNGQSGCVATASYLAGAPAAANFNGTDGEKVIIPPAGYYDGTSKTVTAVDADLIAANIVSGVSIFGVAGSATASPAACLGGNQSDCVASATFPSQSTPATPAAAANVLSGKQFYAGGAMITGTMTDHGAPTITPSTADQSLTAGYYSGGTVQGDADLVPEKILSGTTIFGVAGSATAAFGACSDDALNAGQCSTAAGRYVTSTLGSSISGVDGSLSKTIPQGYYDGTSTATMSDADLLAANIKSGVNIFGVAGNLTAAYSACSDNALNAGQCSTAASRYVASVLGGAVTGANGSLSKTIPQGFYDGSTSCTMADTNLMAENIVSGVTIFGVTGNAAGSPAACLSGNQTGCVANATFPSQSTPATPAAASEVLTGKQFYAGGAMVTGSMANNGAPTITPTTADQSLTAGYYSGGMVQGDADLVAANILSGKNIFGVAGSATAAYSACSDDALNAGQCSTAAGRYVTSTLGGSISGANGSLSRTIPQGYYDGTTTATMSDTNLAADKILSGTTIFGVAGSATASPAACLSGNQTNCVASASFPSQSTPATPAVAAEVLTGKQFYAGGAMVTGSMANNGAPTITPSTADQSLTAGYYSGGTVQGDADLVPEKILSGTTIFGVAGNATAAYSACSDDALNAGQCSTAASRYVTATLGASISGVDGSLSKTIPQGYYDGTSTATMSDADLLAANIKSGVNIFGVAGNLTAAYGACSDNALNAGQCSTAAGRYVASALGGAVTGANGSLTKTIPQGFYDGTTSCTMSDTNLAADKILSGTTIFGVAGSATASPAACLSGNQTNCVASASFPSQSTPATPAAASEVLTGKQFYAGGAMVTGSMANNGAPTITPSTADQSLTAGYYSGGTVQGDADLLAANIKSGVNVFGVAGSLTAAYGACTDNALNAGQCSTAASRYVTSTLGGSISGVDGSLSKTIPQGYYDGTSSATMSDTDLLAANIKSGVNIFGVAGSLTAAYGACSDNALNAGQCSTAASRYVTATLGASISGVDGSLSKTIPLGYYDGTSTATMSDADLLAANIKSGVNIFGVAGNLTAAYGACTDNALNAGQCSTAAGRYVASALGGAVTGANGSLTKTIPQGFYDGTTSCTMSDTNLAADKILSGTTIFGVAGSATASPAACLSGNQTNCVANATFPSQSTPATPAGATDVLSGRQFYAGGAMVTGSMANNGAPTITPSNVDQSLSAGYYSGGTVKGDADLVAANIVSGVTIFGVTGSASGGAYAACTDNALNATQCSTALGRYVTATLGGSITGADGALSKTIPQGYYDGTTTATMSDSDLIAANIKSGVNIFGVNGTAVVESGTTVNGATAADIIAGKEAWDNTGTKLTGTMPNRGNLDVAASWPGGGYYGNLPTNAPAASEICRLTSVLGTAGTASCETSSVFRDQSVTQISQGVETSTYTAAALPAGYRDIPDITKDDNGFGGFATGTPQYTLATRPSVNCGTTQNTIAGRIADCVAQNGAAATWDGRVKGNGGQTVWKLVTRAAADKEVWQDTGTGLLWSSIVGSDNWCRAAGNGQSTSNGYAANDPSTYCNKATNQPNYNAGAAWAVQSWCVESGPVTLVPAAGSGETWSATPTYSTAKGGMGLNATATSPSVRWRLPTNNDYNIADAHGIRMVMPEMVAAGGINEWTATVAGNNRNTAYTFNAAGGDRYTQTRSSSYNLRCVGR